MSSITSSRIEGTIVPFLVGVAVTASTAFALGYFWIRRQNEEECNGSDPSEDSIREDDIEYKMVLCVRTDLKMGKGKIGAQCSHATLGLFEELLTDNKNALIERWQDCGQAKVALKVDDEDSMLKLEKKAQECGMDTYIVIDAGRTQIAPNSRTVLAIGPAPVDDLDAITGHLKLL
mmetsp:Transcript_33812/g.46820  ORF Transcript_33812/g.46820 Transcript_33812/m.46820 type:complete len:176 (-) Transcript_33812:214-741(-)|eukprot:CAMPEP_0196580228 /NCGR_PEP_ID=MMETSP1081-20130531/27920_1 /TAXON_ID=36882 /ORGANISM="Pyramimonas amylifera, Strain CCMP720" /LENGTH=175 /DNA_ID=CAMNT_0041900051 /DNA_START=51 /DNA_END=578 /DNA_ORIENTATION=+